MDSAGVELKAVRLELPIETHRVLRMEAARQEMSMAALVRILVENHLATYLREGASLPKKLPKRGMTRLKSKLQEGHAEEGGAK